MDRFVFGILAHVDAGKTTLSEAMLYLTGGIRRLGRVDHADAFLDTDALERERGITIFSKPAALTLGEREATLLDTPGHADFSAEMERALQALDCAVLVVSGASGVQAHTLTLWRLLERYQIPTFLFINKMDLPGADREALLAQLRRRLGEGCLDFGQEEGALWEEAALCDEGAMEAYLAEGALSDEVLRDLIARRRVFPCYFGSALRLEGVEALLAGLERFAPRKVWPADFAARVYKIARDGQGRRLTFLKVTGGVLRVRDLISGGTEEDPWREKVDQLRLYSGEKFRAVEEAPAGTVCAAAGLTHTYPGQGLGAETEGRAPALEPVLRYRVVLPEGADVHAALGMLRELEEEDPMLRVVWSEPTRQIHVQLMGQIQLEVLRRLLADRFGLEADFDQGGIVYKETIAAPVEGVGHYEPLRHYAEVHLLLEPLPAGSGLRFAARCPEDMLEGHWQRLILTHLRERSHPGVLTGSAITDLRLTLTAGRAHLKHTEGGDFRQATYRAVRQGLMSAQSVLLEPWYRFRLELPGEALGRAISDVQQMGGEFDPPETAGEEAVLTGGAPVEAMSGYWREVAAYTRGQGRLTCQPAGYRPCRNAQAVIEAMGYDPRRDLDNPADSVFCAHGAGYAVPWDQVPAMAHVSSGLVLEAEEDGEEEADAAPRRSAPPPPRSKEEEAELTAIFERTYGQVKRREPLRPTPKPAAGTLRRTVPDRPQGPEYLLVDGYNIIFAWEELKELARENLEAARRLLMDLLRNYQGFKKCVVILVFDAYKVKGNPGSVERWHNIHVVYTKEAETADTYIERATYEIARDHRVRVATSDSLEQLIILGHGAVRLSAREFKAEMEAVEGSIREIIAKNNRTRGEENTLRRRAVIKGREDRPAHAPKK